ncbi:MAG: hypoxanthine phosphoribosyltransferase [Acidimicrobiales bacterium]
MSLPLGQGAVRVLFPAEELRGQVARLAAEISAAYEDGLVLAAVLKGSIPFVADLLRALTIAAEVDFLAISSYAPNTGRVRLVKDLDRDIAGRDVVLVEDIVDTGLTLTFLLGELALRGPRSLAACTLLDRAGRRIVPTPVRFVGFAVGDEYLVGYGLDFEERYRNLDVVAATDVASLRAGATAHLDALVSR